MSRVEEGEGEVVGIVGSAGVGKSRICHELLELCDARGIPAYMARCEAHARDLPLMPVLQMLRSYFAIEADDAPEAARLKVEGAVARARRLLRSRSCCSSGTSSASPIPIGARG